MRNKAFQFMLQLCSEPNPEPNPQQNQLPSSDPQPNPEPNPPPSPESNPLADKKYSEEDVNNILNKRFAKWQAEQEKKIKEVEEAKKLEKMSEVEKLQHQLNESNKRLEELEKKETLSEMSSTARSILKEKGVTVSDRMLARLVFTTAEETKKAVDDFVADFNEAVENQVKERLKGKIPPANVGKGNNTYTRAQIMEIKDTEERQKLIRENPHLFQKGPKQ